MACGGMLTVCIIVVRLAEETAEEVFQEEFLAEGLCCVFGLGLARSRPEEENRVVLLRR